MKLTGIRIGLEHERMIVDSESWYTPRHVKGFPQEVAPHDTMSCLAETRGFHGGSAEEATRHFLQEEARVNALYKKLNLELTYREMDLTQEFAATAYERTHTPKPEEEGKLPSFNLVRGGGLHIHFSASPPVLMDPQFVQQRLIYHLDNALEKDIFGRSFYRKRGQFRMKPWGFEYRSCMWSGCPHALRGMAERAFKIVSEVEF